MDSRRDYKSRVHRSTFNRGSVEKEDTPDKGSLRIERARGQEASSSLDLAKRWISASGLWLREAREYTIGGPDESFSDTWQGWDQRIS